MNTLREIAELIIKKNPGCHIGGSLGLNIQGFETRRQPSDIDINTPHKYRFLPIEGMVFKEDRIEQEDSSAEQDGYDKVTYMFGDVKIEVFSPTESYNELENIPSNETWCTVFYDIMKMKIMYAFSDLDLNQKHRDDLIFMLQNNKDLS